MRTIQYINEDGTKCFAADTRHEDSFHVVGAVNGVHARRKIENEATVIIAEGFATAVTMARYSETTTLAAYSADNVATVAMAIHERYPNKIIIIAGDDEHQAPGNPRKTKALQAAAAVGGVAILPDLTEEQKRQGFTDFNQLATQNPEKILAQLNTALKGDDEQRFKDLFLRDLEDRCQQAAKERERGNGKGAGQKNKTPATAPWRMRNPHDEGPDQRIPDK
jgi:phage/plasmid primase-like uncharacterized protein